MMWEFSTEFLDALIDAMDNRRNERLAMTDQEFFERFGAAVAGLADMGSSVDMKAAPQRPRANRRMRDHREATRNGDRLLQSLSAREIGSLLERVPPADLHRHKESAEGGNQ